MGASSWGALLMPAGLQAVRALEVGELGDKGAKRGDERVKAFHHPSRSCPLHAFSAAPALCSLSGSFLVCQNNAVLFGLQTLQGEFLKRFLLLLCGKKKKAAQ